jgi:hypothetical protein
MRKLALVFALIGGLAACSKNKAASTPPSNAAPEPAPGETGVAPDDDAEGMDSTAPGGADGDGAGAPPPSDPCSGGE